MATKDEVEEDRINAVSTSPHSSMDIDTSNGTLVLSKSISDCMSGTSTSTLAAPTIVVVTQAGDILGESKEDVAHFLSLETKREIIEALERSGIEESEITAVVVEDPNVLDFTQTSSSETVFTDVWSPSAVLALISLHKEFQHLFDNPHVSNRSVWEMISERMHKKGLNHSWEQIEGKWNSLTREYREALNCNARHGQTLKKSPFFDEMALAYNYASQYNQDIKHSIQSNALASTCVPVQTIDEQGRSITKASMQKHPSVLKTSLTHCQNSSLKDESTNNKTHLNLRDSGFANNLNARKFSDHTARQGGVGQNGDGTEKSDINQVLQLLRDLYEDKKEQEGEHTKLLEIMHQEKMVMFQQVLKVLIDVKQSLSRFDNMPTASLDALDKTDSTHFRNELSHDNYAQNAVEQAASEDKECPNPADCKEKEECSVAIDIHDSCDSDVKLLDQNYSLQQPKILDLEEPYSCDLCCMRFKLSGQLRQHKKTHLQGAPHICDVCGKGFKHAYVMIRHKHIHTGYKPHACSECGKKFSRTDDLQIHQRIHTRVWPCQCHVCGKRFKHRVNLKRHLTIHSEDRQYKHWCNICGKGFSTGAHLREHFLTHTGEKPFVCEFCGKGFTSKSLLKRHRFVHGDEKPCKCNVCGKGFVTNAHLKRHKLKIHEDDKPFICTLCDSAFENSRDLQMHSEIHR
ncbi:Zinc finger protein 612 [Plakobranchus ocellatus]|uniref:Zinc finger protein 612 n=1 Tax=Plakobranchus ocellatus TaxID=259542 RepID=A0AAV4A3R9_9GAST|nr:Zinc finger protein 612 [Plakobranchus ocellatus]